MHDYRTAVDRVKVNLGGGEAVEESPSASPVGVFSSVSFW